MSDDTHKDEFSTCLRLNGVTAFEVSTLVSNDPKVYLIPLDVLVGPLL